MLQTKMKLCSLQIVLATADIELTKERVLRVMSSIRVIYIVPLDSSHTI